jgi:hypothetical protein
VRGRVQRGAAQQRRGRGRPRQFCIVFVCFGNLQPERHAPVGPPGGKQPVRRLARKNGRGSCPSKPLANRWHRRPRRPDQCSQLPTNALSQTAIVCTRTLPDHADERSSIIRRHGNAMSTRRAAATHLTRPLWLLFLLISTRKCGGAKQREECRALAAGQPDLYTFEVVAEYPHDPDAFTQGAGRARGGVECTAAKPGHLAQTWAWQTQAQKHDAVTHPPLPSPNTCSHRPDL